jgi:hypothetical protein
MNRPAEAPVAQTHDISRDVELTAIQRRPAARELHVEPTAGGRWAVGYEHGKPALSDHLTANEAQDFAKQRARTEDIADIVMRDAYQHVHEVPNFHPSKAASDTS